jgi:DNA-binding Lrp family transcriptional regulator
MKQEKMVNLLREMIRNSRRSDRELAKALGTSQPTVTRNRKLLDPYIKSYTVVPEFDKIGYEIMAITFAKVKTYDKQEVRNQIEFAAKWVKERPNILFASDGEGLGKDIVMVSVHKDYSKYADFMRDCTVNFSKYITEVQSFIVSLKTAVLSKPFDLTYLADDVEQIT